MQFKEETNVDLEIHLQQQQQQHTQQSTSTLRLGVNNNPMQQYSVILARNLSLDVYMKVYTTN